MQRVIRTPNLLVLGADVYLDRMAPIIVHA